MLANVGRHHPDAAGRTQEKLRTGLFSKTLGAAAAAAQASAARGAGKSCQLSISDYVCWVELSAARTATNAFLIAMRQRMAKALLPGVERERFF